MFLTAMLVPSGMAASSCPENPEGVKTVSEPVSEPFLRVLRVTSATAAIDGRAGRASPLKPYVMIEDRSEASEILEVACRSKHSLASSGVMPQPSSMT